MSNVGTISLKPFKRNRAIKYNDTDDRCNRAIIIDDLILPRSLVLQSCTRYNLHENMYWTPIADSDTQYRE